ncbi:MAG: tetratricopeptide repeat protein [Acidobacteriota bacterium]
MRRTLALSLTLLLLTATQAFAGAEARMTGKIVDAATKEPIPDAEIKLEAVEGKTVKQTLKGKKDGGYAVFLLDGTIRYKFTFSAPGYTPYEETMKLFLGPSNTKNIELYKVGAAPANAPAANEAPVKADTTVAAYNEGATLANAGDLAGAIKKFEEAVAAKPDLLAGWMALAKSTLRTKNYARAIEAANKVLEIDDSDMSMITVLAQAYAATGDKANAAKWQAKLPKSANAVFNDAAKLINASDDAGAEALLKQAIELDAAFAQSYYELGMIYVRGGKSAEAKAALDKYLELDPNGRDAATAKEMLSYLK